MPSIPRRLAPAHACSKTAATRWTRPSPWPSSLAVTHPSAGNLGGGGFMLVRPKAVRPRPSTSARPLPRACRGPTFDEMIAKDGIGPVSVGVPGTVRGLALAHEKFGKLAWAKLVEPARRLAEQGHRIRSREAQTIAWNWSELKKNPAARAEFGDAGKPRKEKDSIVRKDLGQDPGAHREGRRRRLLRRRDGESHRLDAAATRRHAEHAGSRELLGQAALPPRDRLPRPARRDHAATLRRGRRAAAALGNSPARARVHPRRGLGRGRPPVPGGLAARASCKTLRRRRSGRPRTRGSSPGGSLASGTCARCSRACPSSPVDRRRRRRSTRCTARRCANWNTPRTSP